MRTDNKAAISYWDNIYGSLTGDCIKRISNISHDFFIHVSQDLYKEIATARSVLEFGCGTGDFCKRMANYTFAYITGVDISNIAIECAKERFEDSRIKFHAVNILEEPMDGKYDLVFSSNTLEHFKDWKSVLDKLFEYAPKVLLLIPYKDSLQDGYFGEGGAGHVSSFDENSFTGYNVIEWSTFFTHEWAQPPDPLQMIILLEK